MTERREPAVLTCNGRGEIVAQVRRAREYAPLLAAAVAHLDATWEPIDWSEFD